jgi:hypothetical protein
VFSGSISINVRVPLSFKELRERNIPSNITSAEFEYDQSKNPCVPDPIWFYCDPLTLQETQRMANVHSRIYPDEISTSGDMFVLGQTSYIGPVTLHQENVIIPMSVITQPPGTMIELKNAVPHEVATFAEMDESKGVNSIQQHIRMFV